MEKRRKIIQLLCMTIMSYVVLSCNDEIYNDNESQNNRVIAFQTTMKNWTEQYEEATTRGKDAMQRNYQVFPVKGFDTPLQLVAITGDDIDNEKSLSKLTRVEQTDTSVVTRAQAQEYAVSFNLSSFYTNIDGDEEVIFDHKTTKQTGTSGDYTLWNLTTGEAQYWKMASQAITTYAWWPTTGVTFDNTSKSFTNYEVSQDAVNQKDLLYAKEGPTYYTVNKAADLEFKHALTAVQFIVSTDFNDVIKKIELKRLAYKGTFNLDTEEWTVDYSKTDRTFTLDNLNINGAENVVLNPGVNTFFMMPQDLTNGTAEVVFTMTNGREAVATLTHSEAWRPGETVKYQLVASEGRGYVIYASSSEATYDGQNGSISVTSYRIGGGNTYPVRWKVTGYSLDHGLTWSLPSDTKWKNNTDPWVLENKTSSNYTTYGSNYTNIGTGNGKSASSVNLSMGKAIITGYEGKGEDINNFMKEQEARGTESAPFDLSLRDARDNNISRETANCYIVRAPGWYTIPAVYGCAIKNGLSNTDAYAPTNYHNYKGVTIGSPWINLDTDGNSTEGNKLVPKTVGIIWKDGALRNALPTNKMSYYTKTESGETHGYVKFYVDPQYIYQGNAIMALKDASGTVMWSWHIWITNAYDKKNNYPDISMKSGSYTYNLAPDNIGTYYGGRKSIYGTRTVMLRIQQVDETGTIIPFSSTARVYVSHGSDYEDNRIVGCTHFAYGRKDPFPGGTNNNYPSVWTNTVTYPDGYDRTTWQTSGQTGVQITVAESIKFPGRYRCRNDGVPPNYNHWCSELSQNWWNAAWAARSIQTTISHYTVTKSIYDPCPTGYHVPPSAIWRDALDLKKYVWYTQYDPKTPSRVLFRWQEFEIKDGTGAASTISFYTVGGYDRGAGTIGSLFDFYTCWTSGHTGNDNGIDLSSSLSETVLARGNAASIGYAVRPVHD